MYIINRNFIYLCHILFVILLGINYSVWAFDSNESVYGKILTEIRVVGANYTETDIITRELASQVGQPYLKINAEKDFARLDKLDIFSYIKIKPISEKNRVVLEIEVKEIYPYLPFISYEVTDENGFAVGPGFQSVNLLRRDMLFFISARFGGATNINTLFENPWFAGNHLSFRLEFFKRERFNKLDTFNENAIELYLTLGSYLGEYGRFGGRFSFLSIESDSTGRTLAENNRDNLPTFGFFLGYDSRDLWSNPHRGWWNEFEISRSGGFLGADGDFWTFNIDIRKYLPVFEKHTLALFSLTTLRTGEVGKNIPLHQDFHIGGTNSVRGWNLDARRGKNQFLTSAEYRVTVLEPKYFSFLGLMADVGLQLALFGDLGISWNKRTEFKPDNFIGGYGLGLRLLVPFVNMFRFDFALGESGKGIRVHLGSFTKPVAQRFRVR